MCNSIAEALNRARAIYRKPRNIILWERFGAEGSTDVLEPEPESGGSEPSATFEEIT